MSMPFIYTVLWCEVLALTGLATVALARPGLDPPWLTLPMLAAVVSCAVCLEVLTRRTNEEALQ